MTQTQDNTPRFSHGMTCCKAGRVAVGLSCERVDQMCCAWHRIAGAFKPRGLPVLSKFAEHLMDACAWPLADVFWPFNAAGESSALALACAEAQESIGGGSFPGSLSGATSARYHGTSAPMGERK